MRLSLINGRDLQLKKHHVLVGGVKTSGAFKLFQTLFFRRQSLKRKKKRLATRDYASTPMVLFHYTIDSICDRICKKVPFPHI